MNEQGLETIETTTQKTHEPIARIAESVQFLLPTLATGA
jgi:hypothetical protein